MSFSCDVFKMNPINNNINIGQPTMPEDPGLQAVNNFDRLMRLFPEEHPSGIHGIMVICDNNLEKAMDMLLYITQCRKLKEDKKIKRCQNSSNASESDMEILDQSLRTISDRSDEEEEKGDKKDTLNKSEDESPNPRKKIRLEPFFEPPKRNGKGKIPNETTLKKIYTDKHSQFVKIVKLS